MYKVAEHIGTYICTLSCIALAADYIEHNGLSYYYR